MNGIGKLMAGVDNKQVISQFVLFSSVGIIGTSVHFFILIVLVQLLAVSPVTASMAGFTGGALTNYFLNYHVTFRCRNPHLEALPKFLSVSLVGLCLNTLIMALAVIWMHYLISQVLATACVLVWNFFCNRHWTFRKSVVEP
ncbi:GtrA family protein [Desulfurivibrio alkaliphilus]|uniref:GtrA family protein n=1 Tax=Desulfurivibrio alkaliphilus (strain DSM 19089 / UNIQEM U267 / AHT2) TaxID=589865 RepID=D6YZT4_DESAT|nr:GtrA family protein [Desulfurivibrio alkaliphilus]ADH85091.1 GtrA family protein [Desulfurivibrio alkaliphilus AHT 2]